MELIFHEKQEGSLCAQHCLNALLQGSFFTPVDLATLALKMDEQERSFMAESGVDTEEYRTFIQQPSGNMDDSGFFSVQVISSALAVWSLELEPFTSNESLAVSARENPQDQNAYICNYREHWFTIRKLGRQWFNLNSLLSGPELISTTYLSIFLAQLLNEEYSIFIVKGRLPPSAADEALIEKPAVPKPKPCHKPIELDSSDPDLETAIRLSIAQQDEDDAGLAAALKVSLENDIASDPSMNQAIRLSLDTQNDKIESPSLKSQPKPCSSLSMPTLNDLTGDDNEEEMLSEAIRMSLEGQNAPAKPDVSSTKESVPSTKMTSGDELDVEEIRRRRLAYLDKINR